MTPEIRTFQPGDEVEQSALYNAAAASLPGFKPATSEEVRRRTRATDFDAGTRFYAIAGAKVVGYCTIQANGRIGYPWCLPGHACEEALLNAALDGCRTRGIKRLFTCYRNDWPEQAKFFEAHGFHKAREMVNFAQNLLDLPTIVIRRGLNISELRREDLPGLAALAPGVLRLPPERLADYFFANPYFPASSVFVLRQANGTPSGAGILISNMDYAHPMKIDSAAPCFRLGAFGTEGLTTKRINGMFSVLLRDDADSTAIGLDLLSHALHCLQDDTIEALAAQAPSDARQLLNFYQKHFRRQGSFPIYERDLV